jgi:hypothetical protein
LRLPLIQLRQRWRHTESQTLRLAGCSRHFYRKRLARHGVFPRKTGELKSALRPKSVALFSAFRFSSGSNFRRACARAFDSKCSRLRICDQLCIASPSPPKRMPAHGFAANNRTHLLHGSPPRRSRREQGDVDCKFCGLPPVLDLWCSVHSTPCNSRSRTNGLVHFGSIRAN